MFLSSCRAISENLQGFNNTSVWLLGVVVGWSRELNFIPSCYLLYIIFFLLLVTKFYALLHLIILLCCCWNLSVFINLFVTLYSELVIESFVMQSETAILIWKWYYVYVFQELFICLAIIIMSTFFWSFKPIFTDEITKGLI